VRRRTISPKRKEGKSERQWPLRTAFLPKPAQVLNFSSKKRATFGTFVRHSPYHYETHISHSGPRGRSGVRFGQRPSDRSAPAAPSTAPKDTAATTAPKEKPAYTPYKGAISAIDASSVTVTTKKGDVKLAVDTTTIIEVGKKKAALTDFAVGDKVTGSYATGAMTAHSLRKKAAK
jgi:hypothetical protein